MVFFIGTLIIPIILGIILFFFFREKVTNIELFVLFCVSIFSFTIMFFIMRHNNVEDYRYHNIEIKKVVYEEAWNKWITKRCSYTTCRRIGKVNHCTPHYYDCSYCREYPETWYKVAKDNSETYITKKEYDSILKKWGTDVSFLDMNRPYHTKDGDAYYSIWDEKITTTEVIVKDEFYENKTLTSQTLFNHKPFDEEEKKKRGVIDYPTNHTSIINHPSLHDSTLSKYNHLNSLSKDYRVTFIYFKNKDRKIAFDQKRHWQSGNDNELTVCVGLDNNNNVIWVEPFSWTKTPLVESHIKTFFAKHGHLDLDMLYPELKEWLSTDWKKRNFKDFDYIDIELTSKQVTSIWIVLFCINIIVSLIVVKNDIDRGRN